MPWYSLQWFSPAQWQQFRYEYPQALYTIPTVLLLFGLRYLINRRAQQRLSMSFGGTISERQRLLSSVIGQFRYLLPGSVLLAICLLLVAISRPQLVREQRENQSEGIDIMLAIDVSSSMTETDLTPNRLAAARQVAQTFVAGRPNDRIGLVIFAGEAFTLCPLTTDYPLLRQYLSNLREGMIRTSGTAIGDALARCINRMRDSNAEQDTTQLAPQRSKVIVLVSDGDNTAGNLDPVTTARLAKAFGIRLYTIAVGKPSGNEIDEGILQQLARIGNGSFFRATDAGRLSQVFSQINRLEKAPVRIRVYEDVQDYYRPYLYWAILFLLLALFLKNTIFGNILED